MQFVIPYKKILTYLYLKIISLYYILFYLEYILILILL